LYNSQNKQPFISVQSLNWILLILETVVTVRQELTVCTYGIFVLPILQICQFIFKNYIYFRIQNFTHCAIWNIFKY